jgi:hypothetical protein
LRVRRRGVGADAGARSNALEIFEEIVGKAKRDRTGTRVTTFPLRTVALVPRANPATAGRIDETPFALPMRRDRAFAGSRPARFVLYCADC